jgi:RIO-like serine/threonine protein kinase
MFTKVIKTPLEAELQDIAATYGFAPKIQRVDENVVQMKSVEGLCLADLYTDDPLAIPSAVWFKIEHILAILFEREGIEYVDITSYNFMEDTQGKIWIIDFGDAYYTRKAKGEEAENWFLRSVLAGESGRAWNPDFA